MLLEACSGKLLIISLAIYLSQVLMICRHREMMLAVVFFVLLFSAPTDGQGSLIRC